MYPSSVTYCVKIERLGCLAFGFFCYIECMRNIKIVGTLHGGITSKEELEEILKDSNPDQILVELSNKEVRNIPESNSIRDEMIYIYQWAKNAGIKIGNFDVEVNVLEDGINGKENDFIQLNNKFDEALKSISWKELNKEKYWIGSDIAILDKKIRDRYLSKKRCEEREDKMLASINRQMIESGTILIFMGIGHLSYFEKSLPSATFLLR